MAATAHPHLPRVDFLCQSRDIVYDDKNDEQFFALARIKGQVQLVQVSRSSATSLTSVDVKVFRHEFISIFRYDGTRSFHPADLRILEVIDSNSTRYEEENETVFLSRDVMDRISKLSDPRRSMMMMQCQPRRTHAHSQRTRQR